MDDFEPFHCLVDGELVVGGHSKVINPATAEPFAIFHVANERMVERAVEASARAFAKWRRTSLDERRALLVQLADCVFEHRTGLARLLTLEQGKPLAEAQQEIDTTEALFRHYATVHESSRENLFRVEDDKYVRIYTPLGVVAGIIPWNFPLVILAMKVAPALLTGNAIIIKPSPTTPLTTLAFARLCAKLVPAGLLQILGDDGSIGPMLTGHPGIRKISFTGSTMTGRKVMGAAANTLKRLNLELGGNDPAIVLSDADPIFAADGIFGAAFRNCGQVCGAVKRVYVHTEIYAQFCHALAERVKGIVVGDGLQPGVTVGPLQNASQYQRATALLADAQSHGRILAQSTCPSGKGYFVPPTLFADLDDQHALVREEQFAPILPIQRFSEDDEVVARANDTPYGLTASVWSADVKRAEAVIQQVDAALLCINKHNQGSFNLGFSMSKASGTGWMFGDEAIQEFMQPHLLVR